MKIGSIGLGVEKYDAGAEWYLANEKSSSRISWSPFRRALLNLLHSDSRARIFWVKERTVLPIVLSFFDKVDSGNSIGAGINSDGCIRHINEGIHKPAPGAHRRICRSNDDLCSLA